MAGDPYDDLTKTDCKSTTTWDTSSTTQFSTYYETTGTYTNVYYDREDKEDYKKWQKLLDKAIIQKMKDQWSETKNEFSSVPKLRPAIQLRGVCFSGRGWA